MADEGRSQHEVASALGALIAGVEDAGAGVITEPDQEPAIDEELSDTTEDELEIDEGDDEDLDLDGEADPDDQPDEHFLTITYNGEEQVLTESEARMLAQKGRHLEEKLNAHSAEVRDWEHKRDQMEASLVQMHEEYVTALPILRKQIETALGEEPNWVQLAEQVTPQEYNQIRATWNQQRERIQASVAEEQRVRGLLDEQYTKRAEAWRAEQASLTLEKIPEWRDETTQTKAKAEIESYLMGLGITREQFANIHDAIFWQVLRDATFGREARTATSKQKPAAGTKSVKPGSGKQQSSGARRRARQREKVRQGGGRVQDVAPLMADIFESREKGR